MELVMLVPSAVTVTWGRPFLLLFIQTHKELSPDLHRSSSTHHLGSSGRASVSAARLMLFFLILHRW